MNLLNIPAVTGMAISAMQAVQSCQPTCVGLVFQENRRVSGEIRAFHSGDMSNQVNDDTRIRSSFKWLSAGIWLNNLASSTLFFIQLINKTDFKDLTATPDCVVLNPCRIHDAVLRTAAVAHKASI